MTKHPKRQLLVEFFFFFSAHSQIKSSEFYLYSAFYKENCLKVLYRGAQVIPACGLQDGDTRRSCSLAVFNVSA